MPRPQLTPDPGKFRPPPSSGPAPVNAPPSAPLTLNPNGVPSGQICHRYQYDQAAPPLRAIAADTQGNAAVDRLALVPMLFISVLQSIGKCREGAELLNAAADAAALSAVDPSLLTPLRIWKFKLPLWRYLRPAIYGVSLAADPTVVIIPLPLPAQKRISTGRSNRAIYRAIDRSDPIRSDRS